MFRRGEKRKHPRSALEAVEEVAETLERVRFYDYVDEAQHPWRIFFKSLLSGIARGIGFVIGSVVFVIFLSWLGKLLGGMPVVSGFFKYLAELWER